MLLPGRLHLHRLYTRWSPGQELVTEVLRSAGLPSIASVKRAVANIDSLLRKGVRHHQHPRCTRLVHGPLSSPAQQVPSLASYEAFVHACFALGSSDRRDESITFACTNNF